jgi:hypothetical protein
LTSAIDSGIVGHIKEDAMRMRDILKVFGYELRRKDGWWHACRPGKGPEESDYGAGYWRDLIELIVPRPPVYLYTDAPFDRIHADAIAFWARRCADACNSKEIESESLARAAFAAYDLVPTDEELETFIRACKAYLRWMNGELVQLA